MGFDRVTVVPADLRDQASVAAAIAGANAVVNTVSAYVEKGGVTFEAVHVQGQVDLLKADNVASGALPGLRELNIQPKTVKEVVPTYICTRAPGPHQSVLRDR